MNLCFRENLFRKQGKWTQSSEEIMIIHDETDLEDPQITIEDKSPQPDLNYLRVGSTGPTYRPTGLWSPPGSPSFLRWFSTTSKVQSMPLLKVGLIRESRFDVAMDSWAHRTPGAPYKRPPYLLLDGILLHHLKRSRRRTSELHKYS